MQKDYGIYPEMSWAELIGRQKDFQEVVDSLDALLQTYPDSAAYLRFVLFEGAVGGSSQSVTHFIAFDQRVVYLPHSRAYRLIDLWASWIPLGATPDTNNMMRLLCLWVDDWIVQNLGINQRKEVRGDKDET